LFILNEYKNSKCFPTKDDLLNVFSMPINEIRLLIIGQDPYPNTTAIGYAFASTIFTPSLKNISKELIRSTNLLGIVDPSLEN